MTTMTHTDTMSMLCRALGSSMPVAGDRTRVAPVVRDATVSAARAYAPVAPATTTNTPIAATAVATNPWLGGSGSGEGMGNGATTFVDHSIKRIHPGRLEGMT